MAKITYGDIVTEIRGSRGGAVYSKNKYGYYVKPNAVPTNPQSSSQQLCRSLFMTYTKKWSVLSSAQRTQWIDFAAAHPVKNSLGDDIYLTGANWLAKLNMIRLNNLPGLTEVLEAPSDLSVETFTMTIGNLEMHLEEDTLGVYIKNVPSNVITDPPHYIIARITTPLSPGTTNVENKYRFFGATQCGQPDSYVTADNSILSLRTGDLVKCEFRLFNSENSAEATPQAFYLTVPEPPPP